MKANDVFANYGATSCPEEEYTTATVPCTPSDPNYPEFIVPGTPGNPVVPPTTSTDLIVIVPGDG